MFTTKHKSIKKYMSLTRRKRTSHINLSSPCDYWGVTTPNSYRNTRYPKAILAMFLNTEIPQERAIHCAHLCTGECFNPLHMYFATAKENSADKNSKILYS